ncbi:hypothetical protein DEU56DRAFT_900579 [Suillus clintonianus]|uniref:uncharacterized protein n=1 Tax=Suillus clintonianus TaxID=1904413 RepID=UPI001B86F36A|nr:uncharacterized protein DEU56DRAFT_900579 [Suillus clintonianus]KAG2141921.1 hypothetical protein DEU56DRAFT_900579 [Suillus clintonianus]
MTHCPNIPVASSYSLALVKVTAAIPVEGARPVCGTALCPDGHRCCQSNNNGEEGETHCSSEVIWDLISNNNSGDGGPRLPVALAERLWLADGRASRRESIHNLADPLGRRINDPYPEADVHSIIRKAYGYG